MSNVAAIILAAGQGTRFGMKPKLLARLDGKPLVRYVMEAAVESSARPLTVVTGHHAAEIEVALADLAFQAVRNPFFAEGLSTSLKVGFAALPPETEAVVVLLGDMPLVTAFLIDTLVAAWRTTKPAALVPTLGGHRGNPVVLSCELRHTIETLSGDIGAAAILRNRGDVLEWPVDDVAILRDVDTPDMLMRIRRPS